MSIKGTSIAFCVLFLSSCASFNQLAVNSTSGLLYKASNSVETESNLDMIRLSLPANLTLIEGLLSEAKNNEEILATLTKGYVGYAFAVNEADWMIDEWESKKTEYSKNQALKNYTKGFNFGIRYLRQKNLEWNDLASKLNDNSAIMHLFDKNLSDKKIDLETMMFTAQALGAMINLQKDNISLVSQLPLVKTMFDWVCMKNPSINYGTCDIFNGTYEVGRPKMLGGNPEKGKEIFEKAIAKHPHNWLIRMSYVQYYLVPQGDEEGFKSQMNFMKTINEDYDRFQIYNPSYSAPDWSREEHLRFYQAIAIKRFELFEKYKKQLF